MTKSTTIGGTQYPLTESYILGVFAYRDKVDYYHDNPYTEEEADDHELWGYGYSNEEEITTGHSTAEERNEHAKLVRPSAQLFSVTRAMDDLINKMDIEIEYMKIAVKSQDSAARVSALNALWKLQQAAEILRASGVPKGWKYV